MDITVEKFVHLLWKKFFSQKENLLNYGHVYGWLEDEDERFKDELLNKKTAARIIHNFMQKELNIPDSPDIEKAKELLDLYTCRVCTNHIAQVYVKNIMPAEEYEQNGNIGLIFNMLKVLSYEEAEEIIQNLTIQTTMSP